MPSSAPPPSALLPEVRRDTGSYLLALAPLGFGQLATLPLLTRALSPQDLGVLALLEALMTPAVTLGMLGMKFAYLYEFPRADAARARSLLACALVVAAASSLAFGLAAGVGVALLVDLPARTELWQAVLVTANVLTANLAAVLTTELRARRAIRETALISYVQVVASFTTCWWLVTGLQGGINGFLLSQVLGNLAACGLARARLGRIDAHPAADDARAMVRYGWPLTLGLVVRYGMDSLSRLFLGLYVSLESAGDWLLASRVVVIFEILVAGPFFMAWGAHVHAALLRPDREAQLAGVTRWALRVVLASAFGLTLAHQALLWGLAGGARPDLAWLFGLLLLSKVIPTLKSPLCAGINHDGQTGWAWRNNLLALAVFAACAAPLGASLGGVGIALATVAASIVTTFPLYRASQRAVPQALGRATWVAGLAGLAGLPLAGYLAALPWAR